MQAAQFAKLDHGISLIDAEYLYPGVVAVYLLQQDDQLAIIETGTANSAANILAVIESHGFSTANVSYIIPTHVHLDHAGGAGALMQQLPNAKALVHPRGAAHLANPAKLIAGTKAVYGDAEFERMYGEIPPIAAERIVEVSDDMRLMLGASELRFIHTPGHALHHYCIVDADSNSVFTGDTFGISYRVFDSEKGAFIFPATTPVHFDPEQAHASLDRILSFKPDAC